MDENALAGKKGGKIAKRARLELEEKTGKTRCHGGELSTAIQKQESIAGKRQEKKE